MKIISLGRGQGKTTRLLYASEFNNAPILCCNDVHKKYLKHMAEELRLHIPEPIIVSDFFTCNIRGKRIEEILVDDAELVLQQLLHSMGLHSEIKAITLTDNNALNDLHSITKEDCKEYIDKLIEDYKEYLNKAFDIKI